MKKVLIYNLVLTTIQLIIFVAILSAAFYLKYRIDSKSDSKNQPGFVITINER